VLAVARIKPGLHVDSQRSAELRSTAGYALPGVRLEVLDDQGEPLSHNGASVGEICVQANTVMKGYWKQPKLTAECMLGGWFHTGDMGTIDEQGYVRIVDRKKDVIKTAGEIVISTEVENVIQEHPNVAECSVIGLPDAHRGEVPVGIVVAKPDCKLRESDLLKHCRERLASFKVPRRIIFMDALPRGTTGKPLKRQLRRMFSAAAV
jgi:acyl-CoA synthetase (AMP-forming)/AMP-acid ligase II